MVYQFQLKSVGFNCSLGLLNLMKHKNVRSLLLIILVVCLIPVNHFLYAQSSHQNLRLGYDDNLVSISAKKADLKNVLVRLADITKIYVSFPDSLKKKLTIRVNEITIKEALKKLLKGYNYVIIYSGSSKKQAVVSQVYVYKKTKKSTRASGKERRILNQINSYNSRIDSYRQKLANIDANSRRGKRYLRQIGNLEKRIKQLERQIE